MGTRSLTRIYDEDGKAICCMYRQMDGYPDGHGKDLCDAFGGITIINGISLGNKAGSHANGMGCFAAQVVAHFKNGIGGIYLYSTTTAEDCGQDYEYDLRPDPTAPDRRTERSVHLTVTAKGYKTEHETLADRVLYRGPLVPWKRLKKLLDK